MGIGAAQPSKNKSERGALGKLEVRLPMATGGRRQLARAPEGTRAALGAQGTPGEVPSVSYPPAVSGSTRWSGGEGKAK